MSSIVYHRGVSDSTYYPSSPSPVTPGYYPSSPSPSPVTPGSAPPVVMPISIAPYSAPSIPSVTPIPHVSEYLTGRVTILTDAGHRDVVLPLPLGKKA